MLAQATALTGLVPLRIIWLTTLTRTVIPRSLKEPVCGLPHILTHKVLNADLQAKAVPRKGCCCPRTWRPGCRRPDQGTTHSFAPDAAAVGPVGGAGAVIHQAHPGERPAITQGIDVVDHLQQAAAGRAAVDHLIE